MPGITDTALYDRPHFDQPVGEADNPIQAALRATADDGLKGEEGEVSGVSPERAGGT